MKFPIHIERTEVSHLHEVDFSQLQFGKWYSDHMFVAEWRHGRWVDCHIIPFGNLPFSPASSALHYGQIIFEGMKAYRSPEGEPLLFRPEMNRCRFNLSAARMAMPQVPEALWHDALHELIWLDRAWIPSQQGASLYVRPFMFATDRFIGIRPTEYFKFIIITSPAGLYYARPVKVLTMEKYVRAFPGGTGYAKAAGNYGATMLPLREALQHGYDQVLWLDGIEHRYIQEIGTMNVFFVIDDVVITPELDGTILEGVTRDSLIQLLKLKGLRIEERKVSIDEIIDAGERQRLQDAFGSGTAASVVAIAEIMHRGRQIPLPPVEERRWWKELKAELEGIKYGTRPDPFGWRVPVRSRLLSVAMN
ncbi:MAG: branched-chain amino acid aminotransferase [Chitinophagales bacterium]|nr:branched-chain amino acid aminotransferase [Chitinophagales bacterium]MDW8428301.1 branched-chain amino acid aminotransferase [Chitinophagales bacterium]